MIHRRLIVLSVILLTMSFSDTLLSSNYSGTNNPLKSFQQPHPIDFAKMLTPFSAIFAENRLSLDFFTSLAFAADEETETKDEEDNGAGEGENAGDQASDQPCPECPDPAKVILIGLEEKKQALLKEEEALKEERKALEKFKDEIDENLEKLEAVKKQIQDDLARFQKVKSDKEQAIERAKDDEFEKKMTHMSLIYGKMDPEKAGGIISKVDIKVASEIISRIPERKASKILENVDKDQAAKISERLAHRKP